MLQRDARRAGYFKKRRPSISRCTFRSGLLCATILLAVPLPASGLELSGGVSVGAMLAGARPHLVVSPHAAVAWRTEGGLSFALHDVLSVLPAMNKDGVGIHNRISAMLGYAAENFNLSAGPSLSLYSMPACNAASLCGRVVGLSPGGYAQATFYLAGPLGVSASASVDWVGGRSRVLPGEAVVMVVAGPALRWTAR